MRIHEDSRKLLETRLDEIYRQELSWGKVADRLGVSKAYLSDILNGKRFAGPKVLEPLNLELVGYYIKSD